MIKFLNFTIKFFIVFSIVCLFFAISTLWYFSIGLPDYKKLSNYQPPISSRVYSNDGKLIAEYALQKRLFVPYESIPLTVVNSFLSAEDKNFFNHPGVDAKGILRATDSQAIYQKAEGIGFAIPIDDAKRIVDELIRFGKVRRGWLGVSVQEMNSQLSRHFKLDRKKGVLVVKVVDKSPADVAGLMRSDVILSIGGHEVMDKPDFHSRMASYAVDDKVRFSIFRNGKTKEIDVRVISIPKQYVAEFTG